MNLRNYTSSVPVSRTTANIEKYLAGIGATMIVKEYVNGIIMGMSFEIPIDGAMLPIKIPAKADKVYNAMIAERSYTTDAQNQKIRDQAQRTAWKTIHEWIVIQCQMVLMEQAELSEVFMPYIWIAREKKTFFQKAAATQFLLPKTT